MKFITEEDLRDLYRKEPFTDYKAEEGSRLTPGARQFLADRGIRYMEDGTLIKINNKNIDQCQNETGKKANMEKKKLFYKIKSIETLFLATGEELLNGDTVLAHDILNLERQLSDIRSMLEGKGTAENMTCNECTGIKTDNFSNDLEDCFEITQTHMETKNGRKIILLHRLRCELREIVLTVLELCDDDAVKKINQIINVLSQLICSVNGGKECQRIN